MSGVKGMSHKYWPKEVKLEIINRHLEDKIAFAVKTDNTRIKWLKSME